MKLTSSIFQYLYKDALKYRTFYIALLFIFSFVLYKSLIETITYLCDINYHYLAIALVALSGIVFASFFKIRFPNPLNFLVISPALILSAYVIFSNFTISLGEGLLSYRTLSLIFDILVIILLLISIKYFISFYFLIWVGFFEKYFLGFSSGFSASQLTDWYVVFETGIFTFFIGVLLNTSFFKTRLFFCFEKNLQKSKDTLILITLLIVSVHLSNYLYAALAKILLDGGLLSWLDNPTYVWLIISDEMGRSIYSDLPFYKQKVFEFFVNYNFIFNLITLTSQVLVLIMVFNRWFLVIGTIVYDIIHLGIFFATGIFFWKWILLNGAIIAIFSSNKTFKHSSIKSFFPLSVSLISLFLLFASHFMFFITKLGWYDSFTYHELRYYAVTKNEERVEIPTNYFGPYSFRMIFDFEVAFPNHLAGIRLHGGKSSKTIKLANNCKLVPNEKFENHKIYNQDVLSTFIKKHHNFVVQEGVSSNWGFNFYPHHIWSSPLQFNKFGSLLVNDIVGYEIYLQLNCINSESYDINKLGIESKIWVPVHAE